METYITVREVGGTFQNQKNFKDLNLAKNYPSLHNMTGSGEQNQVQKQTVATALYKRWKLTLQQFPYFEWALQNQTHRKQVASYINRDSNSPAAVGIVRLTHNIIWHELKKESTVGKKAPVMSPSPTDFKRGALAHLAIDEVDQIDLGSDEVMELMHTHNKVFDSLSFIISAGVSIAGYAPPQLGPRTLLPNDATDPRFKVPAEHFPIVIANGSDEDDDEDEEHHRQADPTASLTSHSQASPTIPGALRKTGTYQLPL